MALIAALITLPSGCGDGSPGPPRELEIPPTSNPQGEKLYENNCARCHGERGRGQGVDAAALAIKPRNFTRGVFKFTSTRGLPTDQDLFRTITDGIEGTEMRPTTLSDGLRQRLVEYVKELTIVLEPVASEASGRDEYGDALVGFAVEDGALLAGVNLFRHKSPGESIEIPQPPERTAELLALGEKVFLDDTGCARCHGEDGSGQGRLAPGMMDDWQAPITPADLRTGRFKHVKSDEDLYRRITLGIPGTPMLPSELSTLEKWAVVFHVRGLVGDAGAAPSESDAPR